MIAPIVLDSIGIYQLATGNQSVSHLVLIVIGSALFVVIPLVAFHKLRVKRDDTLGEIQKRLDQLENRRAFRLALDGLLGEGNHIFARLGGQSEEAIDKSDDRIMDWHVRVRDVLKGTGYENYWMANQGMPDRENEHTGNFDKDYVANQKNYMEKRLQRLLDIMGK